MAGFRTFAPSVQDALAVEIAKQIEDKTPCDVGYPARGLRPKHIWISATFDARLPRRISGGKQRDEETDIYVRCVAKVTGTSYAAARDAAATLAGYVEDAVTADPTLGGVVKEAHISAVEGQEAIPEKTAREVGFSVTVSYQATATAT
jgi:hypothetical protein